MKTKEILAAFRVLIIVAVLAVAAPPVAPTYADTCCVNTQTVEKNCYSTSCTGTIYVIECVSGFGVGTNYHVMSGPKCCDDPYSTLSAPSGRCSLTPLAMVADVRHSLARTEKIWVRGCDGRYKVFSVPVKS